MLLSILVKIGLIFKIHNTNLSGDIPTSPKMVHTDNTLTIHPYCTHRQSTLTVNTDSKHWLYTMTIHTECIYWWHTLTVQTDGTHLYTDSTNWLYSQTINSIIGSDNLAFLLNKPCRTDLVYLHIIWSIALHQVIPYLSFGSRPGSL